MSALAAILSGQIMFAAHLVPIATQWGFDASSAAALLALTSLAGMAGALTFGWLADKVGGRTALLIACFDSIALWSILLDYPPFWLAAAVVALIGFHGAAAFPTADMRVTTPDGRIWIEGGSNYAASLASTLQNAISCHQGLTAEIGILDANHATGIWAMQDVIEWRDRHPREGWKSILGRGHYHETYQREDGAWRIATLSLARLRLDIVWPDNPGIGEAHAREV